MMPADSHLVIPSAESTTAADTQAPQHGQTPDDSIGPLSVIGAFSNIQYSGEHGSGYSVRLWQQGEKVFGLVSVQNGLAGDPPAGLLENVEFDPRTKRLLFRARLSLSLIYSGKYKGMQSRDVLEFDGILKKDKLVGELKISDLLFPADPPTRKRVVLPRSTDMTDTMIVPQDYAQWKRHADEILSFRGPKW
jgi:hypothetical protein